MYSRRENVLLMLSFEKNVEENPAGDDNDDDNDDNDRVNKCKNS